LESNCTPGRVVRRCIFGCKSSTLVRTRARRSHAKHNRKVSDRFGATSEPEARSRIVAGSVLLAEETLICLAARPRSALPVAPEGTNKAVVESKPLRSPFEGWVKAALRTFKELIMSAFRQPKLLVAGFLAYRNSTVMISYYMLVPAAVHRARRDRFGYALSQLAIKTAVSASALALVLAGSYAIHLPFSMPLDLPCITGGTSIGWVITILEYCAGHEILAKWCGLSTREGPRRKSRGVVEAEARGRTGGGLLPAVSAPARSRRVRAGLPSDGLRAYGVVRR
jgi:hypothetical protein